MCQLLHASEILLRWFLETMRLFTAADREITELERRFSDPICASTSAEREPTAAKLGLTRPVRVFRTSKWPAQQCLREGTRSEHGLPWPRR